MTLSPAWKVLHHFIDALGGQALRPDLYDTDRAVATVLRAYPQLEAHRQRIEDFEREYGGRIVVVGGRTLLLGSAWYAPDFSGRWLTVGKVDDFLPLLLLPTDGGFLQVDQTTADADPPEARHAMAFIARWALHAHPIDWNQQPPVDHWRLDRASALRELPDEALRPELSDDLGSIWWTPDFIAVWYAYDSRIRFTRTAR